MIKLMIIMSILGFIIMGYDKKQARKHRERIPESTLWFISLCFGAVGSTIGMYYFHHKTRKFAFSIGFPILAIAQILICVL